MAVINNSNGVIAWAIIDQVNNSVRDHYNVSSLTDNGTGRQRINLSSAASNNNYAILGTATSASSTQNYQNRGQLITCYYSATTSTSSQAPFACEYAADNSAGDVSHISIVLIGET